MSSFFSRTNLMNNSRLSLYAPRFLMIFFDLSQKMNACLITKIVRSPKLEPIVLGEYKDATAFSR